MSRMLSTCGARNQHVLSTLVCAGYVIGHCGRRGEIKIYLTLAAMHANELAESAYHVRFDLRLKAQHICMRVPANRALRKPTAACLPHEHVNWPRGLCATVCM